LRWPVCEVAWWLTEGGYADNPYRLTKQAASTSDQAKTAP